MCLCRNNRVQEWSVHSVRIRFPHVSVLLHLSPSSLTPQSSICHHIPIECWADASRSSSRPPHRPLPPRRRKERDWTEMIKQPSAGWPELNGNVRLTRSLLSACTGSCRTGKPTQNNTQQVTVDTSLLPFHVTAFCLAVCGNRTRGTIERQLMD